MKRGKINLKFLQYPGKIVDVDLTWAYTVVFILATLFDHGNKYNTIMLIPWLHIKPVRIHDYTDVNTSNMRTISSGYGRGQSTKPPGDDSTCPGYRTTSPGRSGPETDTYRWENNKIYRAFPVFSAWYWGPSSERLAVYSAAGTIC